MPSRQEIEDEVGSALEETANNLLTSISALFDDSVAEEQLEALGRVLDEEFYWLKEQLLNMLFLMGSPDSSARASPSLTVAETEVDVETLEEVAVNPPLPVRRERSRSPRGR